MGDFERRHFIMRKHYKSILRGTENRVESLLENLIKDPNSYHYGGFVSREDGMVHPGSGAGSLLTLVSLYLNPDSIYNRDREIYEIILMNLDYLEKIQRQDGTFDLLTTNFYSSPDTGFIVHKLAWAYKIMNQYTGDLEIQGAKEKLFSIIKKAGYGMVNGGFHTPNHRWVVSAALMMSYNIVKEEAFKDMAERYLREGIDCDENGEYTERSSGIYNAVNDNALIILAEEMRKPELLEHVKRNLDMMLTYIEPDGSVFTQNSVRQDKGEGKLGQKFYPVMYYELYLYMAYYLKNGVYAQMAHQIYQTSKEYGSGTPDVLYLYMIKPELKEFEIELESLPTNYEKYYENSGIVRTRRGPWSYTLIKDSSCFLFLHNGNVRCYAKLCASFFAKAQFKATTLEKTHHGYRMHFTAKGFYRMPFKQAPETWDWEEMDHSLRDIVNELELDFDVNIKEIEDGLELNVSTDGCDRVPIKLELGFTPYTWVEGESFVFKGNPGEDMILKGGYVQVRKGTDVIMVGPGFGAHTYASDMRGSEPKSPYDFTIYMTDFTNINKNISIIPKKL
jgi:hypothetical protein